MTEKDDASSLPAENDAAETASDSEEQVDVGLIATRSHAGPLPSPDAFHDYEAILPGAADRILSMAEREQRLRGRDNLIFGFNDGLRVTGSILVSLSLVGAGVYCGVIGQPELGAVLGASGAFAGVVKAFRRSDD